VASNHVVTRNLPKMVISKLSAETSGVWRSAGQITPARDLSEYTETGQIPAFPVRSGDPAKRPNCLAGAGVLFETVSRDFHCKQGILQGKCAKQQRPRPCRHHFWLPLSTILKISLETDQGISLIMQGRIKARSAIFARLEVFGRS
jgi:hypothetical protein